MANGIRRKPDGYRLYPTSISLQDKGKWLRDISCRILAVAWGFCLFLPLGGGCGRGERAKIAARAARSGPRGVRAVFRWSGCGVELGGSERRKIGRWGRGGQLTRRWRGKLHQWCFSGRVRNTRRSAAHAGRDCLARISRPRACCGASASGRAPAREIDSLQGYSL